MKLHDEFRRSKFEGGGEIKASADANVIAVSEWVDTLSNWSIISHLTFREERSLDATVRGFENYAKRVLSDVSWFYGVEENPSRAGHHVHALIGDCGEVKRRTLWREWFFQNGRARIEPIKSRADVTSYCTKYVCKERTWWNFKLSQPDFWSIKQSNEEPA